MVLSSRLLSRSPDHDLPNFTAAYAIFVRSSEYDLPPEMLDDIVAQSISSYNASSHTTNPAQRKQAGRRRDYDSDDESNNDDV